MHHNRVEHWIVVSGTARVTRGDDVFILSENGSTYIPLGTTHRQGNPGSIPFEIIEVQSGSYLCEDDIVRFEDVYNRVQSALAPVRPDHYLVDNIVSKQCTERRIIGRTLDDSGEQATKRRT